MRSVFEVMGPLIGETPEPRGLAYFTDAAALAPAYGTPPTIICGPGDAEQAHRTDESCSGRGARGERRGPVRDRPALVRALALVAAAALCACVGAAPAHADWNGDDKADVLAVDSAGRLLMYRGTGAGAFVPGGGVPIGSGWGGFTALLAPGDWSGDGRRGPARAHLRRRCCCSTAATGAAGS